MKTKSILALFLAVMMVVSCSVFVSAAEPVDLWDGTADVSWYNDTATEFTLTTAEQLAGLAQLVNGGNTFAEKTVKLGANLQLQSDAEMGGFNVWSDTVAPKNMWTPIGYYNAGAFCGTFDGAGYTISGMYTNSVDGSLADGRVALFGWTKGAAVIKNLTVTKSYANAKNCAAILVAFASDGYPVLTDVKVTESVAVGKSDGTGLLVGKGGGFTEITFTNCYAAGKVTATMGGAGFIGYISGTGKMGTINLVNCSSDVEVNALDTSGLGNGGVLGFVGNSGTAKNDDGTYKYAPEVENINITGGEYKVKLVANRTVGGLIGEIFVANLGNVTVDGVKVDINVDTTASTANVSDIGAVIGYLRADQATGTFTVKNSSFGGKIYAGQNSGIIIGRINNRTSAAGNIASIVVENVASNVEFNTVKGTANAQCIGGVIGLNQKTIDSLTVTGFNTTNTYKGSDAINGADGTASIIGGVIGSGATIKNVTIKDSALNDTIEGGNKIGGVIGTVKATETLTVENVTVASTVTGKTGSAAGVAAELASGTKDAVIKNVKVTGNVTADGPDTKNAAGVVAVSGATKLDIVKTGVTSTIGCSGDASSNSGKGVRNLGGIIGDINVISTVTLDECYFTGKLVTGADGSAFHVAALIGDYDPSGGNAAADKGEFAGAITVKNSYVNTDITGGYNIAGVIGRVYSKNCEVTVQNTVLLGDRVATAAEKTAQVGAVIAFFGTDYTKGELITVDNVYYDGIKAGAQAVAPNNGAVNMFAKSVYYTPCEDAGKTAGTQADFAAKLDANVWDTAALTLKVMAGGTVTPPPTVDTTTKTEETTPKVEETTPKAEETTPKAEETTPKADDTTGTLDPSPTGDMGMFVWVALAAIAVMAVASTALYEKKKATK